MQANRASELISQKQQTEGGCASATDCVVPPAAGRTRADSGPSDKAPERRAPRCFSEAGRLSGELVLTYAGIVVTIAATAMVMWSFAESLMEDMQAFRARALAERLLLMLIVSGLVYGNLVYQFARAGCLKRKRRHRPAPREELERLYDGSAPPLVILVPSYKEDVSIVRLRFRTTRTATLSC